MSDDDLIDDIYNHAREDGWCSHDLSAESLRAIIARVRAHDAKEISDEPASI